MADLQNPTGHVPTYSALPTSPADGDVYICDDNSEAFQWGSSTWNFIGNASSGSGQTGSTAPPVETGQPPAASPAGTGSESPYPELTLGSTLSELLEVGFERSDSLPDEAAVVEYIDPTSVAISWPKAENPEVVHSQIIIRIEARALGGATIRPPEQEQKTVELTPPAAPNPSGIAALPLAPGGQPSAQQPEPQPV